MSTMHVQLHNIPESLQAGDAIECTVDGQPHKAVFLRYGERLNAENEPITWNRIIWVEIANLRELQNGKLVPDMFASFKDEFTVNHAPGTSWHRTAGTCY